MKTIRGRLSRAFCCRISTFCSAKSMFETNVRTRGCLWGIGTRELVQEPVRRRAEAFLMLLRTSTHLDYVVVEEWTGCGIGEIK